MPDLADGFADEFLTRVSAAKLAKPIGQQKLTTDEIRCLLTTTYREFSPDAPRPPRKVDSGPFGDRKRVPPSPEQVAGYSASIGYALHGKKWCDFYEAKGWSVGRTKMKDWQAAVRNWKTNGWGIGTITIDAAPKTGTDTTDYTKF